MSEIIVGAVSQEKTQDEVFISAIPPVSTLREMMVRSLLAHLAAHPPKVSGVGHITHPPNAVERVQVEIAMCACPQRRAELEEVLRDLIRENSRTREGRNTCH